jgi:hypothetical protein
LVSVAGPTAKEKARLIIPFWGAAYLEKLVNITIPALLAPNNLPAMVELFDVDVVLVTERALRPKLVSSRAYANLARLCPIDVRFLDDLMTGVPGDYGVVLSYALYRGFTDLGERMRDTYLMFLNADFIISDGSYRTLARLMKEGHRVIHAPSFRAISEDVMPVLRAKLDPDATTLAMTSREMVDLALKHKHVTVRARTVNQKLYHQWRMDQFYWYVDEATLIGYQWPVALLAIKPETVLVEPTLMWDYAFVPDAAPTLPRHFIADSDDFFMLEPQGKRSGEDMLRLGWISFDEIAKDLSNWTTKEQRDCGRQLFVFHSRDLPNIDKTAAESRVYMEEIYKRLSPEPRPHFEHPLFQSWFSGVQHRIRATIELGKPIGPPTHSVRLEYAGTGKITSKMPVAADRATVVDGTAILACTFVPQTARSILQADVNMLVSAIKPVTAVLALFRGDEVAPVSLVARTIPPDEKVLLALNIDLPVGSAMPLDMQARVGVDGEGELQIAGAPLPSMSITDLGQDPAAWRARIPASAAVAAPRTASRVWFRPVVERLLRPLYHGLFGKIPHLRRTHPVWLDTQFVVRRLNAQALKDRGRWLLVSSQESMFSGSFPERINVAELKRMWSSEGREGQYDFCLCDLNIDDARDFRSIYSAIRPIMKPGGTVIAYVLSHDFKGFPVSEGELFEAMLPDSDISEMHFFGGIRPAMVRKLYKWVTVDLAAPWLLRYYVIGLLLFILAPYVYVANGRSAQRDSTMPIKPWTSVAIELTVR